MVSMSMQSTDGSPNGLPPEADPSSMSMDFALQGLEADPSFLNNTQPLEIEDIPLQVALLTMEVKRLRDLVARLTGEDTSDG
jgi:hypothetical protein